MAEANLITTALKWLLSRPLAIVLLVGILLAAIFGGMNSCYSRRYDKQRAEYEEKSKQWSTERTTLLANAEAKEKQVAELESQVAAFRAAAEQGKKVDDALAAKIDQVSKEAADEAARTDDPADCWVRGDRTCAKLRALRPPIIIDCDEYKRKVCAR